MRECTKTPAPAATGVLSPSGDCATLTVARMDSDRAQAIDQAVIDALSSRSADDAGADGRPTPSDDDLVDKRSGLRRVDYLEILESQYQARHLDLEARRLRSRGTGFYTIGSAGHEGNAALAAALRPDDPAFVHYRSGGFFAQRAKQAAGHTPMFDVLLSLCASSEDPIAGGRHKVFGSTALWMPPQTSTIASHVPKAMGTAFAIERAKRLGLRQSLPFPEDAIVVCTFGDGTLNHASALAGMNAGAWAAYQNLPVPILFVCEDNGVGISVQTPPGWVERVWRSYPRITYLKADGCDIVDTFRQARAAVEVCRRQRAPVFLHLELVRLLGHAGADLELAYHSRERIQAAEARDPVLGNSLRAVEMGLAPARALLRSYRETADRVRAAAREAERRPHLSSAAEVAEPIAEHRPLQVMREAARAEHAKERVALFGSKRRLPERQGPQHFGRLLNWGLLDLMAKYPQMVLFGEDVGRRGGVYGVTTKLAERAGSARVFNTLLDEQSILGLAMGAAHVGLLPVPEIQYLAYYQNAQDQIRGEAATLSFFSQGGFRNPLVVRIASWAYQRGFGGHFHNDNSIAALRDLPGVIIASPSRGDDAVGMLRTALAAAVTDGRVVLFLEPIALYQTRHLHEEGDDLWRFRYPPPGDAVEIGRARVHAADDPDLTIVSWSNGLWRSLQAARILSERHGIAAEVIDLRWLAPIDVDAVVTHGTGSGRILIVDEGRATGGVSEGLVAAVVDATADAPARPEIRRYCGEDTFIPLGPAAEHVLPSTDGIVARAVDLVRPQRRQAPAPEAAEPEAGRSATASTAAR